MIQKPLESLKPAANQLAELLIESEKNENAHNNEEKINRLKQQLGLVDEEPIPPAGGEKTSRDNKNEYVGIWKAEIIENRTFYVRDLNLAHDFLLWANVERIPPKSQKTRILLFGESVARGVLYDPYFNPAICLEGILKAELAPHGVEVIDLARNDLYIDRLKELCTASLKLEPDAAVIFAGNNWVQPEGFSDDEIDRMIELMKSGTRYHELKLILEAKYRDLTTNFLKHTAAVFNENHIPVVVIIPEFNLRDWKCNELDRLLAWPGIDTARWFQLREEAEQALKNGNIDKVEPLVDEMIRINPTSPSAYHLKVQFLLEKNRLSEARENLELALDTKMFRFNPVPGSVSVIRQTMREEAPRFQIPVVDLPREFAKKGIPGKELFIDYCHLTDDGIRICMALTAQKLLIELNGKNIPPEQLQIHCGDLTNDVKARAHLFAAIHNAHKGQPYDILYYHCQQAINLSDSVSRFFLHYIVMASSHAPWSLAKSGEALLSSFDLSQYGMLLQPNLQRIMDLPLVDAMADALKTKGTDLKNQIDTHRIAEHGIQKRKINLLESYYHINSYIYPSIFCEGYYRAYDVVSCFYLLSEKNVPVALQLTCRAPLEHSDEDSITITVNDSYTEQVTISRKWKTHRLTIPPTTIQNGINFIKIHWPMNVELNRKQTTANNLFQGEKLDQLKKTVYPFYGEIHKLTASNSE